MAASAGEQVVVDGALGRVERRGRGEVVGELGEPAAAGGTSLERLGDAQVQLGPAQAGMRS